MRTRIALILVALIVLTLTTVPPAVSHGTPGGSAQTIISAGTVKGIASYTISPSHTFEIEVNLWRWSSGTGWVLYASNEKTVTGTSGSVNIGPMTCTPGTKWYSWAMGGVPTYGGGTHQFFQQSATKTC